MPKGQVTAVLSLEVTYDLNDESDTTPKRVLEEAAQYLASRGLLTGGTRLTVDTWISQVMLRREGT